MLGRSAFVAQKSLTAPCLVQVQQERGMANLKAARPYGNGAQAFYDHAQVGPEEGEEAKAGKTLYVAMTSDRGLCGGVHSSICKTIRGELLAKAGKTLYVAMTSDR